MAEFQRVCSTADIPLGRLRGFEVGHHRIVIAHSEAGFFALADECTHDSAPIADGRVRGTDVMCTRHGARFDLATGAVTAPPAVAPLDTYEIKTEGDDILVRLED